MSTPISKDCTRLLRYVYNDAERLERGKQLAQAHNDMSSTNADFDRVKTDYKARIAVIEQKLIDLSAKVSSGYEMRDIKCKWLMDEPKPGKKTLLRVDTGEKVEDTDMTKDELQLKLAAIEQFPATAEQPVREIDVGAPITSQELQQQINDPRA